MLLDDEADHDQVRYRGGFTCRCGALRQPRAGDLLVAARRGAARRRPEVVSVDIA